MFFDSKNDTRPSPGPPGRGPTFVIRQSIHAAWPSPMPLHGIVIAEAGEQVEKLAVTVTINQYRKVRHREGSPRHGHRKVRHKIRRFATALEGSPQMSWECSPQR